MTGSTSSAVESAANSSWPKRVINTAAKKFTGAVSHSTAYLSDLKNIPEIIKTTTGLFTSLVALDYGFSELRGKTSTLSQFVEYNLFGEYSVDPNSRFMANKLRDRGIDISDCCVEGTGSLDLQLIEAKYEAVISPKSSHSEDMLNSYMHAQKVFLEEKYALEKELALKEKELAFEKELALKEKELALKEKELAFEKELALKEKELAFEKGKNFTLEQTIDKNRSSMESSII
jgi:hypothetical protein